MRSNFTARLNVLWSALICLAGVCNATESKVPVNVIFDTDIWSDMDDALALAMIHALQDRGEAKLLAVTISTDDKWCAPYVDLVNTFYGYPQTPIGMVRPGIDAESFVRKTSGSISFPGGLYPQILAERKNADGSLRYPHRLTDGAAAPEAVALLRKTLSAQPDGSVVIIQVGFSTNLARLLESKADSASPLDGVSLVRKKVRALSVMAGNFADFVHKEITIPKGSPEFNLKLDVPAAQKLFADWPTPIVASGLEIGLGMLYPADTVERDYSYVKNHPIAETYRVFTFQSTTVTNGKEQKVLSSWPHDHPTFDLTSVLYAIRPDSGYFSLSKAGRIIVQPDGSSQFEEAEKGLHRHLILSEQQRARTLEAMVLLASQPPVRKSAD